MTKALNKSSVEVCKPQETFYILDFCRCFLFFDSFDFLLLHFKIQIVFFCNLQKLDYPFLIQILLYSQMRSSLLKYFASFNLSITSPIKNSSVLSFVVTWFSFL